MSTKKDKITRDTNLADLMFAHPQAEEILLDYGLHCGGCIASGFDTIELGAKVHNLEDEDIDEMVERINEVIAHGE